MAKFQVPQNNALDPDTPITLTEQQLRTLPVGFAETFRETGWKSLRAGQDEAALRNFHMAIAAKPEDHRSLIGRSSARVRKLLLHGALEDSRKVQSMNGMDKAAIYLEALSQYELGNSEEGLVKFCEGINKRGHRSEFENGRMMVEATLENCVGRRAGSALTDLAPSIRGLSRKERIEKRISAIVKEPCSEESSNKKEHRCKDDEWNRLQLRWKKRDDQLASVYFGKMNEDLRWCDRQAVPNSRCKQEIVDLAKSAASDARTRLNILRERKPLYHLRHQLEPCQKIIDQRLKAKKNDQIQMDEVCRMFVTLSELRRDRKTKKCILQAIRMSEYIDKTGLTFNQKSQYLDELSSEMSFVYLDRLEERAHLSKKQNRQFIECLMGVNREYNEMKMNSIVQESTFPFFPYKRWVKTNKALVKLRSTDLQRAWLHYDLAQGNAAQLKWDYVISEGFKCATSAKECNNNVWKVVAMYIVVVAECQRSDREEAQFAMSECIEAAKALDNQALLNFLEISKSVMTEKGFIYASIDEDALVGRREEEILKIMTDPRNKDKASDLLARIRFMPPTRRIALVPGFKPAVPPGVISSKKSIIGGGAGGRSGIHAVKNETYHEFLDVAKY